MRTTAGQRPAARAAAVVLVAIGLGAVGQIVGYVLSRDTGLSAAADLRYALVLTLGLYAVVGVVAAVAVAGPVRPRWSDGRPLRGIAIGLGVGVGVSVALLAAISAVVGHLDPDPRVVLLMSEADVPHILAAVLIACVLAPLVEETLFRGMLLETQRHRSRLAALAVSAFAFAVWHFAPSALRYYALLGLLLGMLYLKRGLACSLAAHVGFNAVLTAAAIAVVLGSGPTVSAAGMSLHLPSGWRTSLVAPAPVGGLTPLASFDGPSGATLAVATMRAPVVGDLDQIVARIDAENGRQSLVSRTMREVRLPIGSALEMRMNVGGADGTIVLIPHGAQLYELELHSAGSVKAVADFRRVLRELSLRSSR